ncbi:MAG: glutathione S-transferase family protein [Pseudomonadota bacterium]
MSHEIVLYGSGTTRSSRCRWTLLELELPFEYVDNGKLIGTDQLRAMHPQAKLPALMIDGEPMFESAAICTHLCDLVPGQGMLGAPGTRERAAHMQWTSFCLTEMEAWLWSAAKHSAFYPEAERVADAVPSNYREFRRGAEVLNEALNGSDFLVGGRFSVTDIVVGWTVNWGRRAGQLEGLDHLHQYLGRLFDRPHCTFNPD